MYVAEQNGTTEKDEEGSEKKDRAKGAARRKTGRKGLREERQGECAAGRKAIKNKKKEEKQ